MTLPHVCSKKSKVRSQLEIQKFRLYIFLLYVYIKTKILDFKLKSRLNFQKKRKEKTSFA